MRVTVYERVRGKWKTVEAEMTPAEIKPLRRELRAKLATRLQGNKNKTPFDVTPIGGRIWGGTGGTLTELTDAGICCACLGCGSEKEFSERYEQYVTVGECEHCKGTGDYDQPV